ncbi:hypothetical protein [Paenibacillus sp. NPDC093718]|uniref:hypothetical protein n=1 Tax=Paenibacillus sp. NPDC093718 TaxID=3390601 RepID=UPI003D08E18E
MDYQDMLDQSEERTRYWIGVVSESHVRGNRNWGYAFRYGHFEIKREDFLVIAEAMLGGSDMIQQRTVKSL